ncbi:hypothetical protein [Enterobacter bugandensis]|uniref:hypothetical protein n=1 Tax=Enterobacter bugandensis TaxID=881260 RepID=UPI000B135D10|nr:hypothetical protein [Enterobacter bugandensis]
MLTKYKFPAILSLTGAMMVSSFGASATMAGVKVGQVNDDAQTLVKRLQERYDSTIAICPDGSAAWHCSGLIIRGTTPTHPFTISPAMVKVGTASFSYIRTDMGKVALSYGGQGILLKPEFEQIQKHKKTKAACIYSTLAYTLEGDRSKERHQCSMLSDVLPNPEDFSSCYANLGKLSKDTLAETWVNKFTEKYGTRWTHDQQCSFSITNPHQFYASILLKKLNPDAGLSELILTPWGDENTKIPPETIETVWYDVNDKSPIVACKTAENYARQLKVEEGVTVYPVGIDFNKGDIVKADCGH